MKKKAVIHRKVADEAKEREKQWRELRSYMENYQQIKEETKEIKRGSKSTMKKNEKTEKRPENEVDRFLKSIGLEKYSEIMVENGIDDMEILEEITEDHLEQLGIVLGHRIKIVKKIKELKQPINETPTKKDMQKEKTPRPFTWQVNL